MTGPNIGQVEEMISGLGTVRTRANGNSTSTKVSALATYGDRASMETYLLGHGETQAHLNSMTNNDLVYACKLKQDAGLV